MKLISEAELKMDIKGKNILQPDGGTVIGGCLKEGPDRGKLFQDVGKIR